MRAVSLVPSWTETLIEAGVNVVGRTRFCIHPAQRVKAIPAVGGTKDWDWEKIQALKPDILVLDREENPRFMAEQSQIPFVDTHIGALQDVPPNLEKLRLATHAEGLKPFVERWQEVQLKGPRPDWDGRSDFAGLIEWGRRPTGPIRRVEYVIWKRPWMAVSRDTFIGSTLTAIGFGPYLTKHANKYPELDLEMWPDKESTLLLFSSEPFPFVKVSRSLAALGFPYALVDGESFSWFGVRSLKFLETAPK